MNVCVCICAWMPSIGRAGVHMYACHMFDRPVGTCITKTHMMNMGSNERLAFFVNVYNSLTIHAVAALGGPADLLSRLRCE